MHIFAEELLREIASIGCDPGGGVTRLGFSPEDRKVRQLFRRMMLDCGLEVREDAFGNLFGRVAGKNNDLPAVATGSHLDTVPNGGNYDGVLGCVSGLAALREIRKLGGCRHPLELIAFQIEESSRFACSTMGSKLLAGSVGPDSLADRRDLYGASLPEVMAEAGLSFGDLRSVRLASGTYRAFVELHMDQGPTLEEAGLPLGVITHIVGVRRARVYFSGLASHAGGTRMASRRDALVAASEAVLALNEIASSYRGKYSMVGTTGRLKVQPGAINVVPGSVEMQCELRGTDAGILNTAWNAYNSSLSDIAAKSGTPVRVALTESTQPVTMDDGLQDTLRRVCKKCGVPYMDMASGAGHDCMNMAALAPSGMLFVRNRDGLSHHPNEFVRSSDIESGCRILCETLVALGE